MRKYSVNHQKDPVRSRIASTKNRCAKCKVFITKDRTICKFCAREETLPPVPVEQAQEDMDVLLGLKKPDLEILEFDMAEALRILQSRDE